MSKFRFGFIPIFVAGLLTGIAGSLFGQSGIFDRIGIIPGHGSHGSLPEENIDLFTGNVTLRYRDVFLPGPNGFNLEVWRIYNSKILKDRQSGNPVVQAYHRSWVRIGWTMHMGMVHAYTSNSPIIEFPDGRLETAFPDKYHSGKYMTKDFLTYEKTTPPKLYFQDGVIWTFGATATLTRADGTNDPVRLVTKIENSFGHHIDITYVSGTPCMSSITDAMGRVVTFVSGGTPRRLVRIMTKDFENNDRILNYAVGTFSPSGYTRLDHFSPPVLPSTTFEYNSGAASDWELRKVNASYGGALEYTYANHDFFFNGIVLDSRVMIQKKITYEPGNEATWDYSYPDYDGVVSGTVSVDGPVFDTSVTYNAYDPGSPWEIGLISGLQYGDGSLSKSYGWTFQQVSDSAWWVLGTSMGAAKGPLVSTIDRHEEGSSAIKEEYLYENGVAKIYGLATKALNYVNGSELPTNYKTTDYYFLVYSDYETKHLLKLPYIEQEYTGEGVKQKERTTYYYHETGKYGAVLRMTVLKEGSTYCEWTYDYICHDSQGKSIQIHCSGPNDSFTSEQYSYGVKTSCTIGDTSIFHRVVSVYDSSIQYEISQDEATYYYDYDALGRVILRDWPNDRNDEITAWNLNNAETTQGGHKITRFWDGMGRDTGYIEAGEGEATLYYRKTLDAEGRLVAENIGSIDPNLKTEYTYNAAGNITETKDPLNRTTHITYSGTTKTVTDAENHPTTFEYGHLPGLPTRVTDAQGHASVNTYDPLGRLINVTFNGERTHGYEYDRADNLLAETHPETGRIEYSYDDENRLVEKHWGGTVTKYYHNSGGQVVLIEIGDGSDIDEKIFLLYWRGRLIEADVW